MAKRKTKKLLDDLKAYGAEHGHRITDSRLYTLESISNSDEPLTAYDILDLLSVPLNKPKPPTVYRALEFLIEHHFIHRIESLNAYVACGEDHKHKGSQFMVCDDCGRVEEVHLCHVPDGLKKQAEGKGFTLSHWNAELHGRCGKCG